MDRLIGIAALVGLTCAVAVHVLTFISVRIDPDMPQVWLLHLGIFVVFLPLVVSLRRTYGQNLSKAQLCSILPRWANTLVLLTFAYVFVNFVLFFLRTEGGSPEMRDGLYVLQSHGKVIRELSYVEFKLYHAYVLRGFSGHWLVFYLVPSLYFLVRRNNQEASIANGP